MRQSRILLIILTLSLLLSGCKKKPRGAGRAAYPLHRASRAGDLEEVQRLLSRGTDVNARDRSGNTPLH